MRPTDLRRACRGLLAAAAVLLLAPQASHGAETPATLTVQATPAGPRIEPAVYGHFAEHLGTGVYGGLWVGPESPIANTRGWRNDVVAALRRVQVPVLRWPGGCFADDYDWRDGIGDPALRPVRLNRFWGGVPETNRVGTHEFMDLAEQLGSAVYLAGNMGSLPPRSMAQWLEYLTSDSQASSLAQERRRNGRDKPWAVQFFGVGNESWGCGGNMRPEYAADLHRQYATWLSGAGQRVASGDGEGRDEVTDIMLARAKGQMDAISLHHYTLAGTWEKKGQATVFDEAGWARVLRDARVSLEEHIERTERIMDRHDPERRIALFVDEWGTWYDAEPGSQGGFLFQQNTLRDAMVAALSFQVFHRHTARVKMANIAQMVNVLQALVLTDGPRMLLTPTYHVFEMHRGFQGATPLQMQLASVPEYAEGDVRQPALQATAARAADGRLLLALVNLEPRRAMPLQLRLDGLAGAQAKASGRLLTAPTLQAHNRFEQPDAVAPVPLAVRLEREGGHTRLPITLPPHAIVVVTLDDAH